MEKLNKQGYKQTELGLIPEDWEVKRIGEVVSITTGAKNTQDKMEDGDYPFFVRSQTVERINTFSYDGEAVLTAGDGVGTGKIFHYINGKFDFHQRVYKMSEFSETIDGYFFYLFFSNHFYDRIMQMTAKSSVDSVRREMIANMRIVLPPKKEQTAIATALSDMDSYISSLEALIAKKRLVKQGAMQELLTAKEGWEVREIGTEIDLLTGFPFSSSEYSESGIRLLRGSNIKRGVTDWNEDITEYWPEISNQLRQYVLQEGDIVIAMDGSLVGRSFAQLDKSDLPALLLQRVARVRSKKISLNYLKEFICSDHFTKHCDSVKTSSAIPHISPDDIRKYKIPVPPKIELQEEIASTLRSMSTELVSLENKLDKAKQIKQGMMQDLLTGRVRLV